METGQMRKWEKIGRNQKRPTARHWEKMVHKWRKNMGSGVILLFFGHFWAIFCHSSCGPFYIFPNFFHFRLSAHFPLSDPTEIPPPIARQVSVFPVVSQTIAATPPPLSVKTAYRNPKTDLTRGVSQKKLASEAYHAIGGVARNGIANRATMGTKVFHSRPGHLTRNTLDKTSHLESAKVTFTLAMAKTKTMILVVGFSFPFSARFQGKSGLVSGKKWL